MFQHSKWNYASITLATLMLASGLVLPATSQTAAQLPSATPDITPFIQPFAQPNVPTDVTGIGGSLGHAQGLRNHLLGGLDKNTVPDSLGIIVARDPRYCFTGCWTPVQFGQSRLADGTMVRTVPAVIATSDRSTASNGCAQIMSTSDAEYCVQAGGEIVLTRGALLLKASPSGCVNVVTPLCQRTFRTSLSRAGYAMVSNLDGHLTVANLSDESPDSCVVNLINCSDCSYGTPVRIGQLMEVYQTGECAPANELVAYRVLNRIPLASGLTVETMWMSYPRAFKRFNLTCSMNACEVNRILKSAAAVSYVDSMRKWDGPGPGFIAPQWDARP